MQLSGQDRVGCPSLGIVIPMLNSESTLENCLKSINSRSDILQKEIIAVDGGSSDNSIAIAEQNEIKVLNSKRGRGFQLKAGAEAIDTDWLLFIHSDTTLERNWEREVVKFIELCSSKDFHERAAAFLFVLDDTSIQARVIELGVNIRSKLLKLPYGDQGFLISRFYYSKLGGFRPIPLMEDVEIVRRVGGKNLTILPVRATTSAQRFKKNGYFRQVLTNWYCLFTFLRGGDPFKIDKLYNANKCSQPLRLADKKRIPPT